MKVQETTWMDGYGMEHRVSVFVDEAATNPREDYDHVGTIVYWHRNYILGDEAGPGNGAGWLEEWMESNAGGVVMPVYAYEHSGVALSLGNRQYPFNCPWDGGQLGYIYATNETLEREFGKDWLTEQVEACFAAEIEEFNQYLSGDVYYFVHERREPGVCSGCRQEYEWLMEDSICGFYGHDFEANGLIEAAGLPEGVELEDAY